MGVWSKRYCVSNYFHPHSGEIFLPDLSKNILDPVKPKLFEVFSKILFHSHSVQCSSKSILSNRSVFCLSEEYIYTEEEERTRMVGKMSSFWNLALDYNIVASKKESLLESVILLCKSETSIFSDTIN